MKKRQDPLMMLVQSFFRDHLAANRGLSPNTVLAYRDAVKMFLNFIAIRCNKPVAKISPDDLNASAALEFLDQLEKVRKNGVVTRNLRLAALRTFFLYLSAEDPLRAGEYQRVLSIPIKRAPRPMMGYLEPSEVKAILDGIERTKSSGERDYVLLNLLYNTGARVQEVCDLRIGAIRLGSPALVTLKGKGGKTRHVPIWAETATLLRDFLAANGRLDANQEPLFLNSGGSAIGRFGIRHIIRKRVEAAKKRCPSLAEKKIGPHTFRHTTAMHLLQAGVELSVIRSWLGHVSLSTTHAYVEIDLDMKRKALATCKSPGQSRVLGKVLEQHRDVIRWLDSL